jgi:uncharacterized protein (DUF885 family)
VWDAYFRDLCRLFPTLSTQMGYDDDCHRLENWASLFSRERQLVIKYVFRSTIAARRHPDCVEAQTFHIHMITRLRCLELDRYKVFHKDGGWCVEVLDTVVAHQRYATDALTERACERLRAFPEALLRYVEMLRRVARHRPPSRVVVERMRERIHRMVDASPPSVPERVGLLIRESLLGPVRRVLLPFLRSVPCGETLGLHGRPLLYAAAIYRHVTMDGVTAEDIHEFGLREVRRIEGRLEELPSATDARVFAGAEAVERYASIVDRVQRSAELVALFGDLRPSRNCRVEEMRKSDRVGGPLAYYSNATFSVNTAYEHPEHQMEALAFHEAVPGHHTQRMIERDSTADPDYRYHLHHTAFIEGWAMYAESLLRPSLPHSERGVLESEVFRAVRLVVDTGIHCKGWSYDQAVAYMRAHGHVSDEECRSEVVRYACFPGQALGYHVGRTVFLDIRRRHEADLAECHRKILLQGSVPLRVLVRQFLG